MLAAEEDYYLYFLWELVTHSSTLNLIPELLNEAKKLELQGLKKYPITPVFISKLDTLLNDAYAIRRPKPIDYHNRRDLIRILNAITKELYGNFSFLSCSCHSLPTSLSSL